MISKSARLCIATLALLTTSFAADAADVSSRGPDYRDSLRTVVSYYNWTGFYGGFNGGTGWGTSDWDAPLISLKPKGWMAGGTLGYNYQLSGPLVWGLEGDLDWTDVSDSVPCGAFNCTTKNTWLATARGRVGYAFDRWMPYLTGGAAFGRVEASSANPAAVGASHTMGGWTVGAGVEVAVLGNWTAKVEYLYADLGKFDCNTACGAFPDNVSLTQNIIRFGVNYRFTGPVLNRY